MIELMLIDTVTVKFPVVDPGVSFRGQHGKHKPIMGTRARAPGRVRGIAPGQRSMGKMPSEVEKLLSPVGMSEQICHFLGSYKLSVLSMPEYCVQHVENGKI